MAWNLKLQPKGLLLSKYARNIILLNPENINGVEQNSLLSDQYQTYSPSNNYVDLEFDLALINTTPTNKELTPSILGFNYIQLSNDPGFKAVVTLMADPFAESYDYNTDYVLDLASYDFASSALPATQSVTFSTQAGQGRIKIQNWPLSGSSGPKKVFLYLSVNLSNGTTAQYPEGLSVYDEITVCSSFVSAPSKPESIAANSENYAKSPLYFSADVSNDTGDLSISDSGVASYLWDGFIINESSTIYKNYHNSNNLQMFAGFDVPSANVNQEIFPKVFTTSVPVSSFSTSAYQSYITDTALNFTADSNIFFAEYYVKRSESSTGSVSGNNYFYEFNITNSSGLIKYLRQQIVLDETLNSVAVYNSVDPYDATNIISGTYYGQWYFDTSYIPSQNYSSFVINNPQLAGLLVGEGNFISLVEAVSYDSNIMHSKLLFRPLGSENSYVINDFLFTADIFEQYYSQDLYSFDLYSEFRWFIQNSTYDLYIESNQYGICQGVLSAAETPTDKIKTDENLYIQDQNTNYYVSEKLNTWSTISNSRTSGVVNADNITVQIYNNDNYISSNDISSVEIQSNVPTFSNNAEYSVSFKMGSTAASLFKIAYSYDADLDFEDFVFDNLLKTEGGQILPKTRALYDYSAFLNWSGNDSLSLNIKDVDLAQICSYTTSVTDRLFFYSHSNTSGTVEAPTVVKTQSPLSTSAVFSAWIGTNGYSTSSLLANFITIKNLGNDPISISSSGGLGTVNPGQPYIYNFTSINSASPNTLSIITSESTVDTSINFLYDFGQSGTITSLSLTAQIATPPECPETLPQIYYSIETSRDFLNWEYISAVTESTSFTPSTGNYKIDFTLSSEDVRYARLRIYVNGSPAVDEVWLDPRQERLYSSLSGKQTVGNVSVNTTGRFLFGFTDTNAKDSSLGALYNQPTYLRQFVSNDSTTCSIVVDFSEYDLTNFGPVFFKLFDGQTETEFYRLNKGFSLNQVYVASFSIERLGKDKSYYLQPRFVLKDASSGKTLVDQTLDNFIFSASGQELNEYGFYPFASLVGSGFVTINNITVQGKYNKNFDYSRNKTYFTLYDSENLDYMGAYGKNLLAQNSYNLTGINYPQIGNYFANNTKKEYLYEYITFNVRAVATRPVSLYGPVYTDGVYLDSCDYILVTAQFDPTTNGVYQVQLQQWNKISASATNDEPVVYVSEGNIFNDTIWMLDKTTYEWIPNVVACPFVLNENSLLFTDASKKYAFPQYIKIPFNITGVTNVGELNQPKIKLVCSPDGILSDTNLSTQWNGLLQNGELYSLNQKLNSNNTIFNGFVFDSAQILGVSTSVFPSIYYLLVSYVGNYNPVVGDKEAFVISRYGTPYRMFVNQTLVSQLYSTYSDTALSVAGTGVVQSAVYAYNVAGIKSLQSGFSSTINIDNVAPTLGTLTKLSDNPKSIELGLSTAYDSGSGLYLARTIQENPLGETAYGSWFGFGQSSFVGISSLVVYPSYLAHGEPLSGYYKFKLQVADQVGNLSETNFVENFYYEVALVDTTGPKGGAIFVDSDTYWPISFTSSSFVTACLNASDATSEVKAFRYKILPGDTWSTWLDYSLFSDIFLPENIDDGILSIEFQFKDFGNNIYGANIANTTNSNIPLLNSSSNIPSDNTYNWNNITKQVNNVLFTVVEPTTFSNKEVLLIGGSQNGQAVVYTWDKAKLVEILYPGFVQCGAITAMLVVDDQVIIGADNGYIFNYQNGVVTGPFAKFKWGDIELPVSKFELHTYEDEGVEYVYASTLNIPRIFRTVSSDLKNLSWDVVQPEPISLESINVVNSGLWSGTSFGYSISSSFVSASLTPTLSYGISSVIVSNPGSNLLSAPTITVSGPISGAGLTPIMQGSIGQINLISAGTGYTNGATVIIAAPAAGGVQATGFAITGSNGQIVSIQLDPGGAGYGYTSLNPTVTIVGVGGSGSNAVASARTIFDSIYSVTVNSAGYSANKNIVLTTDGGAVLVPTFLYRVTDLTITAPGFGYTSDPQISINGITTLATADVINGSIQSASILDSSYTFTAPETPSISVTGGESGTWTGSITTSPISWQSGTSGAIYPGFVISGISISSSASGFGTVPGLVFSNYIYEPKLDYRLSDDILLNASAGSIYDIKSFDDKLFVTSSTKDLVAIGYNSGSFTVDRHPLNLNSASLQSLTPYKLATYTATDSNLFYSFKEAPFVGRATPSDLNTVTSPYASDVLLFKPYNFDILSNWQLIKIIGNSGSGSVKYNAQKDGIPESLSIITADSQVFYESTKNNTWANRCSTSGNYAATVVFDPIYGTQCLEISTYTSTLKVAFSASENDLTISFGNRYYTTITTTNKTINEVTFVKSGADLYIYKESVLVYEATDFYDVISAQPVIKFGCAFEPQTLRFNGQEINIFGTPDVIPPSSFSWYQFKFSFDVNDANLKTKSYSLNIPYTLPNVESIRVLKNIDGNLFAAGKAITDVRSTTNVADSSTKVYRLNDDTWSDVTGGFESYNVSISSSYQIVSPNDLSAITGSYYITGLVKAVANDLTGKSILLGLSSNYVYEEQSNVSLVVIYPNNYKPAGTVIYLSSSTPYISVPSSIIISPFEYTTVVPLGISATSYSTSGTITVTDGIVTENASLTILPIGISSLGLNTNSFTGYSLDSVIANISLNAAVQTPRTITFTSNNQSVLGTLGVATVAAGKSNVLVGLTLGAAVTTSTAVTVLASYRSTSGIATATARPFVYSQGFSTSYFVGNESVRKVVITSSVDKSPVGVLTVSYSSNNSSVLSVPANGYIAPYAFGTSSQLTIGAAVTQNTTVRITGSIIGTVSTGLATAMPFVISSASSDFTNPVWGLQTSTVTFTLNTTPQSDVFIRNVVSSLTIANLVFPTLSTVFAGSLTTSFGISTTSQYSAGIAITVQGAPLGYNTSPTPGLILSSNIWRITALNISPTSIVGAGAQNAAGVAQSYTIGVTLNVGLATTVQLTSSSAFVVLNNITFSTTGSSAYTEVGFATGLSTSLVTGLAITAIGPNGVTSTVNNLTLNPFLIASISTGYIWNGISTSYPNYIVGGIGASAGVNVVLNAYTKTGVQTVTLTTPDGLLIPYDGYVLPTLGISTINIGYNSATIFIGALQTSAAISTSITAKLSSSSAAISTTSINIRPVPLMTAVYNPIISGRNSYYYLTLDAPLPVSKQVALNFDFGQTANLSFAPNQLGITSYVKVSVGVDTVYQAQSIFVGSLQTSFVAAYAASGGVFGMGYNYYGELSRNYPVIGPVNPVTGAANGSAERVYMGLPYVIDVASGYHHNLALTRDGLVYAIGANNYYQLGKTGVNTAVFTKVTMPGSYISRAVYAQRNTSYVITADNSLYAFGSNSGNSLGTSYITGGIAYTSIPRLISTSVQLFSAYEDHGAYVTYNSRTGIQSVYEFGAGATTPAYKSITQLSYAGSTRNISNMVIHHIDAGPLHTLAAAKWTDVSLGVQSSGVIAWGINSNYQTGASTTLGVSVIPNILLKSYNNSVSMVDFSSKIFADYNFSVVETSIIPVDQYYVSSVTMGTFGTGYQNGAIVAFSAPPVSSISTSATGIALTSRIGVVTSVTIAKAGSGLGNGTTSLIFDEPPSGAGNFAAQGIATLFGNAISSVTITNQGYGYTQVPNITIVPPSGTYNGSLIANALFGIVTSIVLTSPGFGYTQTPTVTITGVGGLGVGATASVGISSLFNRISAWNFVGLANSSNPIGFGLGLGNTSVATVFTASGEHTFIELYKVAKNPHHYAYINSDNTMLVSGGVGSFNSAQAVLLGGLPKPEIYGTNMLSIQKDYNQYLSYVINNGTGYNVTLFGKYFANQSAKPKKLSCQGQHFQGAQISNHSGLVGGFAGYIDTNNDLEIYYNCIGKSSSYFGKVASGIKDVSVALPFTQSKFDVDLYAVKIIAIKPNTTTNETNVLLFSASMETPTTAATLDTSPYIYNISGKVGVGVAGAFLKNYRDNTFTYNGNTYTWLYSSFNCVIGFTDGTVDLYGDAIDENGVRIPFALISTWSIDGSAITCTKNIENNSYPNQDVLFIATEKGKLVMYQGNGDPTLTYADYVINPTESLPVLAEATIGSHYGYIKNIQPFIGNMVIAATSNNYVLCINMQTLAVMSYIDISANITTILGTLYPLSSKPAVPEGTPCIFVTTENSNFGYSLSGIFNYEMGLNYQNAAAAYQTLTADSSPSDTAVDNIVDVSISDTFTLIVDSSKPTG